MSRTEDFITIYRPDVFDCFRLGSISTRGTQNGAQLWFATCLAYQYEDIAKRHGCELRLSPTRLEESRLFWVRDTKRIDIDGDTTPDHFKQAGFLTYWLRRRLVVNFCQRLPLQEVSKEQDKFILAANEVCAFLVGFRLCLYFELGESIESEDHVGQIIERMRFDSEFKFDIATLLKQKNVSPHSLYLIFRALFYDFERPRRRTNVVKLVK